MILSYKPTGETERRKVEAVLRRVSVLGSPSIFLLDGTSVDLFDWQVMEYKVVQADWREKDACQDGSDLN